ncbi:class III lanthipeptide [Staphylococcus coagulans]
MKKLLNLQKRSSKKLFDDRNVVSTVSIGCSGKSNVSMYFC